MGVHEGEQQDDFAMSADRKYLLPARSPQWLEETDRASLLDSMCSTFVRAVVEGRQAVVEETPIFHSAERSGLLWLIRGPSRSDDPLGSPSSVPSSATEEEEKEEEEYTTKKFKVRVPGKPEARGRERRPHLKDMTVIEFLRRFG